MGELAELKSGLNRYKIQLSEQQKAELNSRQYLESLVDELRREVTDSQEGLLDKLVKALPEPTDLTPIITMLDPISGAITALIDAVEGIANKPEHVPEKAPETDLSPVLEAIKNIKIPKQTVQKARSWEFEIERDKRGDMIGVTAYPGDMV